MWRIALKNLINYSTCLLKIPLLVKENSNRVNQARTVQSIVPIKLIEDAYKKSRHRNSIPYIDHVALWGSEPGGAWPKHPKDLLKRSCSIYKGSAFAGF